VNWSFVCPERAARYDDFVFDSIKNKQPFYQIDQVIKKYVTVHGKEY
jgi:hypothetical protein